MKKTRKSIWIYAFLSIALILANCTKESNNQFSEKEKGILKLSILTSTKDQMVVKTIRSVPLNKYHILIYNSSDEIYLEYNYLEDVPEEISLTEGTYYVVAESANDSIAAFENPYFYGKSEEFTIGSGKVTSVKVNCNIANCAVKINYANNITEGYTNFFTVIKSGNDSLVYNNNESRTGYFQVSPLSIYCLLSYELTDGSYTNKVIEGSIENPKASNLYSVTIDATPNSLQTKIDVSIEGNMDTVFFYVNDFLHENDLTAGDILITEILYDPSSLSDTDGEWFEIYNNTLQTIDLQNMVILSNSESHIISKNVYINPGEYYLMAKSDTAFDEEKYIYSAINLSNTSDHLGLYTYGSDGTDGNEIASLTYDESGGFPIATGASINLSTLHYNYTEAMLASSWCISTDTTNTGDLGTPVKENISCD